MLRRAASIILSAGLALATAITALPVQAAGKTYSSELTGEPISTSIQNQRPIAVMIDNDKRAYPHYGLADADIVYELINSTKNSRVTRLMAVYTLTSKILVLISAAIWRCGLTRYPQKCR